MLNQALKDFVVARLLPRVQTPAQYLGCEHGAVLKDHRQVAGTLCLAFPDTYSVGMSHYGLQVLYGVMNSRADWACERAFAPMSDMERLLREYGLPLWSLESFTPLCRFDVLGFTLQYELSYANVLTILDLGRIPLRAVERKVTDPLVIAGGPGASNPEPMAPFIDLFVIGDGEESLPQVCEEWLRVRHRGGSREVMLAELAARLPFAYVPRFYQSEYDAAGRPTAVRRLREDVPERIEPAVVADLDAAPLPRRPIVPYVECVHDRITIEIMRGCPNRCRFCQSATIKRPVRWRRVETILRAAEEMYWHSGHNEISLLALSSSDYPHFEELMRRLRAVFRPLRATVSLPSLRVNESLRLVGELLNTDRHSGLTLAPEAARDELRRQIGKRISNKDLYDGCRRALANGFRRMKLYFMCGLPGESPEDLDGIVEMADAVVGLGQEVAGRPATVVVNVSNFVPKPQTPLQWAAMQTREYFRQAHDYLFRRLRGRRNVQLRCHQIDASLLEGVLARGDRRVGEAIERAWRAGARFDAWSEHFRPDLWWQALAAAGIEARQLLHLPYPDGAPLPWDHIGVR